MEDYISKIKQELINAYTEAINLSIEIDTANTDTPNTTDYLALHEAKDKLLNCCHEFLVAIMNNNQYDDIYNIDVNYAGEIQNITVSIGEDSNVWIEFPDESYCEDREMDPFDLYNITMLIGEDLED